jgi:predicted secreted protein
MSIFSGVVMYLIIWWMSLFCVLPFGNTKQADPEPGTSPSAPENPRLGLKFLITTGLAALIWVLIFTLIEIRIIDFHESAEKMFTQDRQQ